MSEIRFICAMPKPLPPFADAWMCERCAESPQRFKVITEWQVGQDEASRDHHFCLKCLRDFISENLREANKGRTRNRSRKPALPPKG